jgi:hypothetical protein
MIALIVSAIIIGYVAVAGVVHGWLITRPSIKNDWLEPAIVLGTVFWPFVPFFVMAIAISNRTSSAIEKRAAKNIDKTKARIDEIKKVRVAVEQSKRELHEAEEELERELSYGPASQ